MSEKPKQYLLMTLSSFTELKLKEILKEYGYSDSNFIGRIKRDLIDMVCQEQDKANKDSLNCSGLGSKVKKISIRTETEYGRVRNMVGYGSICEVEADVSGRYLYDKRAIFVGEVTNNNGRIIALKFRMNGTEMPIIWKKIRQAYLLA